jgi:translocation protein SEC63
LKDSSKAAIKKQYRDLSLKYHPDRNGGDSEMFVRVAKAYEA